MDARFSTALLGQRVVFLRGTLDDKLATDLVSQLLLLSQMDATAPVDLYINSPGGSFAAALTVYDVMRSVSAPVSTRCIGTAGGASVLVVAAGALGRRFALPHARLELSDESQNVPPSRAADVARAAEEAARVRQRWRTALLEHVGRSASGVERDLAAGRWLSAAEARDYGLVDGIIPG